MRARRTSVCAILAGMLLLAGCATPTSPAADPTGASPACVTDPDAVISHEWPAPDRTVDALTARSFTQAVTTGLAATGAPGAAVAIVTADGTWTGAFGSATPDDTRPMALDDHVRIGSVTKTFTGTLVLQLAQEGRLRLDEPVSRFFPDVPEADAVTIRMLMEMTSGIASYTLDPAFQERYFGDPQYEWTPDQLIAMGTALPRSFAPGASFEYSNTNTIMLGRIIELVTGESYGEALRDRILVPLGLGDTSLPSGNQLPAPAASGITLQGGGEPAHPIDATNWSPSFGWSAGALISTVPDLVTYGKALITGDGLLDRPMQRARIESVAAGRYGEAIGCTAGWVGHTGELPGYNTVVSYDTASQTLVVVGVNSDIRSGACTQSPTLPGHDDPALACMDPAVRVLVEISQVLGHPYRLPSPQS